MDERFKHITEALTAGFDASEARELARWVVEELPENADSIEVSRAVDRLLQGEPVQYVFEHALWLGLDLRVTPATDTLKAHDLAPFISLMLGSEKEWTVICLANLIRFRRVRCKDQESILIRSQVKVPEYTC